MEFLLGRQQWGRCFHTGCIRDGCATLFLIGHRHSSLLLGLSIQGTIDSKGTVYACIISSGEVLSLLSLYTTFGMASIAPVVLKRLGVKGSFSISWHFEIFDRASGRHQITVVEPVAIPFALGRTFSPG